MGPHESPLNYTAKERTNTDWFSFTFRTSSMGLEKLHLEGYRGGGAFWCTWKFNFSFSREHVPNQRLLDKILRWRTDYGRRRSKQIKMVKPSKSVICNWCVSKDKLKFSNRFNTPTTNWFPYEKLQLVYYNTKGLRDWPNFNSFMYYPSAPGGGGKEAFACDFCYQIKYGRE